MVLYYGVSIKVYKKIKIYGFFNKYICFRQGYTVLLYGVGSKRCLINDFHKNISYHPSLIINGFFPSLTTKDVSLQNRIKICLNDIIIKNNMICIFRYWIV